MSRTSVTPDALTAAIAIVNALRRRQYRRETLRGIAPIVALALCVALAIGFALYVAAIDVLDAAPRRHSPLVHRLRRLPRTVLQSMEESLPLRGCAFMTKLRKDFFAA
jgi:hypothetical protein